MRYMIAHSLGPGSALLDFEMTAFVGPDTDERSQMGDCTRIYGAGPRASSL